MNIAIDGPAGAGKSTIARAVAQKLGSIYVDTGAMYRTFAVFLLREGVPADDTEALEDAFGRAHIGIRYVDGTQRVFLGDEDVTDIIRTEEVTNMASVSSANARVRELMVELQQKMAAEVPVVMDGRDIGTVVLPDAELKIFLTADPHVRALRRYNEQKGKPGYENVTVEEIERDIRERDYRDTHREASPLKKADDAVLLDTSDMTIEEVTEAILALARDK